MNLDALKQRIIMAQLDYGYLDTIPHQLTELLIEYQAKRCSQCTHGCPIAGANTCHTGCTLFAAVG